MSRVSKHITGGSWLDYGCADGGYTASLLDVGATTVAGVDIAADRVDAAQRAHPDISFHVADDGLTMFRECTFDGVFMNEVFEHVTDENRTLQDVRRILRPGGRLIIISPNRGFPFEGHTVHIGRWSSRRPTPIVPWLPRSITDRWVSARNYWPQELRRKITSNGFAVIETGFIMPVFENYSWIPEVAAIRFRRQITTVDHLPGIRRLGVSNLVVAVRHN